MHIRATLVRHSHLFRPEESGPLMQKYPIYLIDYQVYRELYIGGISISGARLTLHGALHETWQSVRRILFLNSSVNQYVPAISFLAGEEMPSHADFPVSTYFPLLMTMNADG